MLVHLTNTLKKRELRIANTVMLVRFPLLIRNLVILVVLDTTVALEILNVVYALLVCFHRLQHLQHVLIVSRGITLPLLLLVALLVNRVRFQVLVLLVVKTVSQGREKRITNVMLVLLVVSVMLERHRATLVVQLELMEDRGRPLALVVKLENILLLVAPFVNFV